MPKNDEQFQIFLPLYKVEEQHDGSVLVYTRGTQEVPDAVGEIMDYASTAPEVRKWSEDAFRRSKGLSYGNIRAMHGKTAAGKVAAPISYLDNEKAIDLVIKVVDPVEVKKVKEGVYTGASMGGSYKDRWPDTLNPGLYRYTGTPNEFSLVDAPAVPTATFQMIKADGTQELCKFASIMSELRSNDEQPPVSPLAGGRMDENPSPDISQVEMASAPPVENVSGEMAVVADTPVPPDPLAHGVREMEPPAQAVSVEKVSDLLDTFASQVDRFAQAVEQAAAMRRQDEEKVAKAEVSLKALGSNVGIARRDGEPLAAPVGYPVDSLEYGDPANWSYPVDTLHFRVMWGRFNEAVGKSRYSPREWAILGRRIARLATRFGPTYKYNPTTKQIEKVGKTVSDLNKNALTSVVADLRTAAQGALDNINDPEAVMNALHQILAGIDVASDVEGLTPPTSGTFSSRGESLEAAVPAGTSSTATTPATNSTTGLSSSTSGTTSGSTPSSSSTSSEETKALAEKVNHLEEMIQKLLDAQKKPEPVQKGTTLGDLNAQVQQPTALQGSLEKAISAGAANYSEGIESDHIQQIMEAAGGNPWLAQNRALEMARQSLAKRGLTSSNQSRLLDPALLAAIRGQAPAIEGS